jgi:zinc protease
VHRDHLDAYYDILRRVVLEPRFDAADFDRLREDQVNAITAGLRASDDEGLAKETLNTLIHEDGAYGRPVEGTVRALGAVTREDVLRHRRERFTRERASAAIAGDVPGGFVRRVESDLASLPAGASDPPRVPASRTPEGIELTVVTKPCRAWAISIGHPIAVTRADDDFYPLFLANSYFGEHRTFNGVLMNKMRSERGLNYGDYSYVETFAQDAFLPPCGGVLAPRCPYPARRKAIDAHFRRQFAGQ